MIRILYCDVLCCGRQLSSTDWTQQILRQPSKPFKYICVDVEHGVKIVKHDYNDGMRSIVPRLDY